MKYALVAACFVFIACGEDSTALHDGGAADSSQDAPGTDAQTSDAQTSDAQTSDAAATADDASIDAGTTVDGGPVSACAPLPTTSTLAWEDQSVYVIDPSRFANGDTSNDYMKNEFGLPSANYGGGFAGGDL